MSPARVNIVDDDAAVRDALHWLLQSRGVESVGWADPLAFLDWVQPDSRGCVLLDVRMPSMNGIELFDRLRSKGSRLPAIFLTGHGDVPMAVQAIKDGAFDFLEKPYDDNALVDKVLAALNYEAAQLAIEGKRSSVSQLLAQLTQREREVMDRVLAGKLNKVIADELGIAMRTVEVHRARVFEKMNVRSAVELSRLLSET